MNKRLIQAVGAAMTPALCLSACGSASIDSQKAEREIAKGYQQQVEGAEVSSVDCPAEIAGEVGATAVCELTLKSGDSGDIDLKVVSEDGQIRWKVAKQTD